MFEQLIAFHLGFAQAYCPNAMYVGISSKGRFSTCGFQVRHTWEQVEDRGQENIVRETSALMFSHLAAQMQVETEGAVVLVRRYPHIVTYTDPSLGMLYLNLRCRAILSDRDGMRCLPYETTEGAHAQVLTVSDEGLV